MQNATEKTRGDFATIKKEIDDLNSRISRLNYPDHIELVNGLTIVLAWCDIEINSILIRIAAPSGGCSNQMADRSTCSLLPKAFLRSGSVDPSTTSASRTFFWLAGSQLGISSVPGLF